MFVKICSARQYITKFIRCISCITRSSPTVRTRITVTGYFIGNIEKVCILSIQKRACAINQSLLALNSPLTLTQCLCHNCIQNNFAEIFQIYSFIAFNAQLGKFMLRNRQQWLIYSPAQLGQAIKNSKIPFSFGIFSYFQRVPHSQAWINRSGHQKY